MTDSSIGEYELSLAEKRYLAQSTAALVDQNHLLVPENGESSSRADAPLPPGLRSFLSRFKQTESQAAVVIHGYPVSDNKIGPTPAHWQEVKDPSPTLREEIYLKACASQLGKITTWPTLQSGREIQDVLPIKGDEMSQSGHGSEVVLELHTEDGFHEKRCDYLLLQGLRNPDYIPTSIASIQDVRLDEKTRTLLSKNLYHIFPDDEHIVQLERQDPKSPDLARMIEMRNNPQPVSVLFGNPQSPYLRVDFPFMECVAGRNDAKTALDSLMHELRRVSKSVVIKQGSLLIIDNYKAVHGRSSFEARYDGTDRWIKKALVRRKNLRLGLRVS